MKVFTLFPRLLTLLNYPLMFEDSHTWKLNADDTSLPPFVMFLDIPSLLWYFTFQPNLYLFYNTLFIYHGHYLTKKKIIMNIDAKILNKILAN